MKDNKTWFYNMCSINQILTSTLVISQKIVGRRKISVSKKSRTETNFERREAQTCQLLENSSLIQN